MYDYPGVLYAIMFFYVIFVGVVNFKKLSKRRRYLLADYERISFRLSLNGQE